VKKLFCRICGKNGFEKKYIKIKLTSGILDTSKVNKKCIYCKSAYVEDYHLEKLIERNLIKNEKLTREGLKFLDELEFKRNNRLKKNYKEKVNKSKKDKSKFDFSIINLVPESIFGITMYILVILFCIWIFGDYGGECGVDYGPRFFGEC
jgi:hypothetical protein